MKSDRKLICEALGILSADDLTSAVDARNAVELSSAIERGEVMLVSRCWGIAPGGQDCILPTNHRGKCSSRLNVLEE